MTASNPAQPEDTPADSSDLTGPAVLFPRSADAPVAEDGAGSASSGAQPATDPPGYEPL